MAFGNMWRKDPFQRDYTVVGLKKDKKGFPKGYLRIGSSLYKITVTHISTPSFLEWETVIL